MNIQNLSAAFSDLVQRIYAFYDQLGLSVTGLLVAGIVFGIALLFAVRELIVWFLKIDDVKKDLRRIRDSLNEVEGELRALQTIIAQQENRGAEVVPAAKAPSFPLNH